MTGFEYALAGLMIAEGLEQEGSTIVKSVRGRYDGEHRNPWNEMECGSNYARSMSSYALLPIFSGFTYDMTENRVGFAPICKGDWEYLWSIRKSWGSVRKEKNIICFCVQGEPFELSISELPKNKKVKLVTVDEKPIEFTQSDRRIKFETLTINKEIKFIME